MFAIKVMNAQDLDYTMYSANSYRVQSRYSGGSHEPTVCEKYIVLDEECENEIKRTATIDTGGVAYVMNHEGKTIDTIRN